MFEQQEPLFIREHGIPVADGHESGSQRHLTRAVTVRSDAFKGRMLNAKCPGLVRCSQYARMPTTSSSMRRGSSAVSHCLSHSC